MPVTGAALMLGLGAGASFGPVNVEITKVGLVGRTEEVLPLAVGTWTGDALLLGSLATALAGASATGALDTRQLWFRLLAASFIIAIAVRSLVRGPAIRDGREGQGNRFAFTVSKGVALSALSPYGIVLWAGLGAALLASSHRFVYGLLIMAGDGAWFCIWLTVLRLARSRISPRAVRPIHVVANGALVVCAALLVLL